MSVGGAQNTYLHCEGEGARGGSRHQSEESQRSGLVKPAETVLRGAPGFSTARPAGSGDGSLRRHNH